MNREAYKLPTPVGDYFLHRVVSQLPDVLPGWYVLPPGAEIPGCFIARGGRVAWVNVEDWVLADLEIRGRVEGLSGA